MSPHQPSHQETQPLDDGSKGPPLPPDERPYLVVFDSDTSQKIPLPEDGEVLIGRGENATIRLRSPLVSRRHAQIDMSQGDAYLVDLQSHNGVVVNGKAVAGRHLLRPRDIITLANVTLIFYAGLRAQTRRALAEVGQLRTSAAGLLKQKRPFSLVTLALRLEPSDRDSVEQVLPRGPGIAAWSGVGQLLVYLPGLNGDQAESVAATYVEALTDVVPAKAGCASYPADGATWDALMARADSAVLGAHTGEVSSSSSMTDGARLLEIGGTTVLIADAAMVRLYTLLERLAASALPILIGGETGTGKELAASAVHHWSSRRDRPFLALNCAALPETLAESELFGYEKGAFSGAVAAKTGLLESARGGTVFLDEIGELSLSNQAKLLRVLETRKLMRLGDVKEREIDIRIVAATNRNLEAEADAGRFRRDLFFRLSGACVWLPPLRDRPREILSLAKQFLDKACERSGSPGMTLSPTTAQVLLRYRWPGNLRELKNVMEYLVAAGAGPVVDHEELPARVRTDKEGGPSDRTLDDAPATFRPIDEELRELEMKRMAAALAACDGNQTRAAELIDMPRRTFVLKLRQYNLLRRTEEK